MTLPTSPGHQLALVPADADTYGPPPVPVTPIATSGRTEYTAACPCGATHRHTRPGVRRGPCGALYTVAQETPGPAASPA